jgi:hypothetical protein
MYVKVIDPLGFEHTILFDQNVWGLDNIFHAEDREVRAQMLEQLLQRIFLSPTSGEWRDYRWSQVIE